MGLGCRLERKEFRVQGFRVDGFGNCDFLLLVFARGLGVRGWGLGFRSKYCWFRFWGLGLKV